MMQLRRKSLGGGSWEEEAERRKLGGGSWDEEAGRRTVGGGRLGGGNSGEEAGRIPTQACQPARLPCCRPAAGRRGRGRVCRARYWRQATQHKAPCTCLMADNRSTQGIIYMTSEGGHFIQFV